MNITKLFNIIIISISLSLLGFNQGTANPAGKNKAESSNETDSGRSGSGRSGSGRSGKGGKINKKNSCERQCGGVARVIFANCLDEADEATCEEEKDAYMDECVPACELEATCQTQCGGEARVHFAECMDEADEDVCEDELAEEMDECMTECIEE